MNSVYKIVSERAPIIVVLCAVGGLCYLAASFETFPGDRDGIVKFQALRTPWLDDLAHLASHLANALTVFISVAIAAVVFWVLKRRADTAAVLLVLVADGLNQVLKQLVGRSRPDFAIIESLPGSPAFPSGHAFHVFLFLSLLVVIAGEVVGPPWLRRGIQGMLVFMILACGASRVYLGVHWPSDVVGGFLLAGLVLVPILRARKKLLSRVPQ